MLVPLTAATASSCPPAGNALLGLRSQQIKPTGDGVNTRPAAAVLLTSVQSAGSCVPKLFEALVKVHGSADEKTPSLPHARSCESGISGVKSGPHLTAIFSSVHQRVETSPSVDAVGRLDTLDWAGAESVPPAGRMMRSVSSSVSASVPRVALTSVLYHPACPIPVVSAM